MRDDPVSVAEAGQVGGRSSKNLVRVETLLEVNGLVTDLHCSLVIDSACTAPTPHTAPSSQADNRRGGEEKFIQNQTEGGGSYHQR